MGCCMLGISKFGRNEDVDAAEDIEARGGDYAGFPTTTAEEFQVNSSDANDAAAGTGARTVRIWYLDDDYNMFDANGDLLYTDVTLNGITYVDTGITGMRVWRMKVLTSGSGKINAGNINCRWKTTTSVVFPMIAIGKGQTDFAGFTIPNGYTGYLRQFNCEMEDNTANDADMTIKTIEPDSNTERLIRAFLVSTSKNASRNYYGGPSFTEKTDFIFRCTRVTNANADIVVDFSLLLVKN